MWEFEKNVHWKIFTWYSHDIILLGMNHVAPTCLLHQDSGWCSQPNRRQTISNKHADSTMTIHSSGSYYNNKIMAASLIELLGWTICYSIFQTQFISSGLIRKWLMFGEERINRQKVFQTGTWRNNNVAMSFWRNSDIIIAPCVRWVCTIVQTSEGDLWRMMSVRQNVLTSGV